MNTEILKKLNEIVAEKYRVNKDFGQDLFPGIDIQSFLQWETYLDGLQDEIDEVRTEHKDNNSVYLEDELWDILWNYLNLLYCFEQDSFIDTDKVYERCIKKYSQRLEWAKKWVAWNDIKSQQKKELLDEHNKKYNA